MSKWRSIEVVVSASRQNDKWSSFAFAKANPFSQFFIPLNMLNVGLVAKALLILCLFIPKWSQAQGFQRDSLQFKIYTSFDRNRALTIENIEVEKIFCDYCSDIQLEAIGEQAKIRTYGLSQDPDFDREAAYTRITLVIRISKEDFANIKEEEPNEP